MFVPNFEILGQVVPEKSLTKISIFITLERKKKGKIEKKEGKIKSQHLGFVYSYTLGRSHRVYKQNLKTLAIIDAELI